MLFEKATNVNVEVLSKWIETKKTGTPLIYATRKNKDGVEVAAMSGLTIGKMKVKIGDKEATLSIHNDVTMAGLEYLKHVAENGNVVAEKHVMPTRTGKGFVLALLTKNGERHNSHIYVTFKKSNNSAGSNVSIDDIEI